MLNTWTSRESGQGERKTERRDEAQEVRFEEINFVARSGYRQTFSNAI
jgi:hypothetical protein